MANKRTDDLALNIFKKASSRVPAYRDFLKRNKINPKQIRTAADFRQVPQTDKKNYIDNYDLRDLVWNGKIGDNFLINSSSGTTGKPYYWPLDEDQVEEGTEIHRIIFKDYFKVNKRKTLLLICFGMGTWIAGTYTLLSAIPLSRDYPLTVMTPGFNKDETIRIISQLSPDFQQIIIAGMPTFLKDLVDEIISQKKRGLIKGKTRLLLSGEGISEHWREYMANMLGSKKNDYDILSILGSAEAAVMGFETPETIKFRQLLDRDKKENFRLFKSDRVPAIAAYMPTKRHFEVENGELLITCNRSVPLIRYNIHDQGGVLNIKDIKLPLVYVFGRGKFTATIYAANIYPENITMVLLDKRINKFLTGRFFLETRFNNKNDHHLRINVELTNGTPKNRKLSDTISDLFVEKVPKVNSELARVMQEYGSTKTKPRVILYENNHEFFRPESKIKKLS
jgi:phenylacetate-CoA ligase